MEQRVSAILPAAGLSRRMGTCKQLLPLGNKTVIARCIEAMIFAGIEEIVVVVGPGVDAVAHAVAEYPVKIARNEEPESDMAESVRVGLRSIGDSASGVLVSLADHPLVSSMTYSHILVCHRIAPTEIIIPVYKGRKGHPTLFPRPFLDQLIKPLTLRDMLRIFSSMILPVPVPDIGVTLDMDTMEDYERVLAYSEKRKRASVLDIPEICFQP